MTYERAEKILFEIKWPNIKLHLLREPYYNHWSLRTVRIINGEVFWQVHLMTDELFTLINKDDFNGWLKECISIFEKQMGLNSHPYEQAL